MSTPFATIEEAIQDLKQGRMIILVDAAHRENEGDLVIAAEKITPEAINFMIQEGRGLVCLTLLEEDLERLQIPMMVAKNTEKNQTAFTVSIDAAEGIATGISPHDRARTIQVAIDPFSKPHDLVRPGHIFPICARPEGVLARQGQTEGSVDLARLAGLKPSGVICEIINKDGSMARLPDLKKVARKHALKMVTVEDLIRYRTQHETLVKELASTDLPLLSYGNFTLKVFSSMLDNYQHLALIHGEIDPTEPCLVRVHSECLTGDLFGSARCDCGWQLHTSLNEISKRGGVLIYLRQEGRGIGLVNKIKAYALQDKGFDTVEANQELGFSADQRDYAVAAQILRYLDIKKMTLLTNNPKKMESLAEWGCESIKREAIQMPPTPENRAYLKVKREKLGHLLDR
jgi:3,4-dihydroxy 2-butanone 4-phosphate synthase / GTP cyclohydrolase II